MKIQENILLAPFTTFQIGGAALFFTRVSNLVDLQAALAFAESKTSENGASLPVLILGGGSNVLISDEGFKGLVIKNEIWGIAEENVSENLVRIIAGAGEGWDDLVKYTVEEKGLYGMENLSLIPGTVGASPVQNIGAYGVEISDILDYVEVYNPDTKKIEKLTNSECEFGYRQSIFKDKRKNNIILRVAFLLKKKAEISIAYKDLQKYFENRLSKPSLCDVRSAIIEIRQKKLPDFSKIGTAGSFFKNVMIPQADYDKLLKKYPLMPAFSATDKSKMVKVPTAWILDNICGFKGVRRGEVGVYENQALVLVNYGKGTAQQIKNLSDEMIASVKEKTGITIVPEVEFVG
jgi:UDP-N-acetylmuramate dehydrogenase